MVGAVDADRQWVLWALLLSSVLNVVYLLPVAIKGLMPTDGSPAPAPFKRPGGAPAFTVVPLCITAAGTLLLFVFAEPVSQFLQPVIATAPEIANLAEPVDPLAIPEAGTTPQGEQP
jgi:multicomponent Na+:H+ antiporter subunit D